MAKVLFGQGITDISGSIAGNTFSRNRGGSYIRRKGQPTNPDTPAQQAARAIVSAFSQNWRNLTQAQRDAWNGATGNFPFNDRLGQQRFLSGEQLYVRLNSTLAAVGLAPITAPPIPGAIPNAAVSGVTIEVGTTTFDITLTDPSNAFTLQVFATPPLSPGIEYVKQRYKQIAAVTGGGGSPIDVWSDYIAVFGVPPVGTKVFSKVVVVANASGLSASGSSGDAIVNA